MTGVLIREGVSADGNAAHRGEEDAKKKKSKKDNTPRINGWGLREYSKIVSKKVEAKGRTTYNEILELKVADEIFAELTMMLDGQELDEKNIRRRVYDAFNMLIAMRVFAKDKKEIKWMGLSNLRYEKIKTLEEAHKGLTTKVKTKKKLLQEIEKQFDDLQHIKFRNQVLQKPAESANGIRLPFLLVKTSRKARVEIEISEDSKFACFDFNCTPFTLHDDVSILNGIKHNSLRRAGFTTRH
ncbi:hypothetical protein QOZ80_1BG0078770 [Eleusine coracana subsp. coracana]|nr:hypothetical protein QOZ80_1BG0078770 [Eleusine coracana subsp. coracana]